jgi:hypothetical protein
LLESQLDQQLLLDAPEGTQVPFGVGDYVTLTGSTYHDFTHQKVLSIDTSSGVNGYFQTRMTVDYNSSGILTAFNDPDATIITSNKVSVFGVVLEHFIISKFKFQETPKMKLIREEIEKVEVLTEESNGKKNLFIKGVFLQAEW